MLPSAVNLANKTVIKGSAVNDYFVGGVGTFAFFGCAGLDTLDYSTAVTGVTFDLSNRKAYNNFNGPTFTVDLFFDVEIFRGGFANDNFIGGPGFHDFIGGDGADTLDYSVATTGVTFDIAQGRSYNNFSGTNVTVDHFSSIEIFKGGNANDVFIGGAGFHALYACGGLDVLDYSAAISGVTFDFSQGKAYNNFGSSVSVDQFSGISIFKGGSGNDVFIGGSGYHYVVGNGGSDTLDYSSSTSGITFDLVAGRGYNNFEGTVVNVDQFTGIERFVGGNANDVFIISNASSFFSAIGGGGTDKLVLDTSFAGQSFDLSDHVAQYSGIEIISLSVASGVSLIVSDADVLTISPLSNALYILGGSDDEVIPFGDWQVVATNQTNPAVDPSDTFTKFHSDAANSDLFISSEITLPPGGFFF